MSKIVYPLAKDTIDRSDLDALANWLRGSPRLTQGDGVKEFEKEWAKYIGTKYAVFCNSGSSANLLMAYAVKCTKPRNRRVVVPSVGWVTTIAPFMQFGFDPIMVGADEKTYGIDLDDLEKTCIEHDPATVIFVQVLGVPHHKDRLLALSKKYNFTLLEDGCAALGAHYGPYVPPGTTARPKTMVGAVGKMASFSFYFGHQLATIEGGMVNTDDFDTYQTLLMLRSHGWGKDLEEKTYAGLMADNDVDTFHQPFTFFLPGFNVRGTDLQAYLGLRQIQKASWVTSQRHANHLRYAKNFEGLLSFQDWGENYPVSISFGALAKSKEQRTRIVKLMVASGIETRIFSAGNLGKHPFWKEAYGEFSHPVSDRIHDCGFFLPNNPSMMEEEVDHICEIVKCVL
jgi:CDP-4-dehydro-6-deoxyglucose reductase, E1